MTKQVNHGGRNHLLFSFKMNYEAKKICPAPVGYIYHGTYCKLYESELYGNILAVM